jgi:hypothetical protein
MGCTGHLWSSTLPVLQEIILVSVVSQCCIPLLAKATGMSADDKDHLRCSTIIILREVGVVVAISSCRGRPF